jgi:hypothetical protein
MKSTITMNDHGFSKTPTRIDKLNKWLASLCRSEEFRHIQINGTLWTENAYTLRLFFPKLTSLIISVSSLSYTALGILLETVNVDLSILSIRTCFTGDISKDDSKSIMNSLLSLSGLESIQLHMGFDKNEEMNPVTLEFWAQFFGCLSVKLFNFIDIKLSNPPRKGDFLINVFNTGIISNSAPFLSLLRIKINEDTRGVVGELVECIVNQINQCKYIESLEILVPISSETECDMMDKLEFNDSISHLALFGYDGFRIDRIRMENIEKLCIVGKVRTCRKQERDAFVDSLCDEKKIFIRVPVCVDKAHVVKVVSKNLFLKVFHVAPSNKDCALFLFRANQILKENGFRISIMILWMNQSHSLAGTNRELYLVMKKNAGSLIAMLGYFL